MSKIEKQIIEEFQRRAHDFLPDPPKLEDLVEWQSLIQHFGGPTRLLDFTRSFYIGTFFAVEKATRDCAIWCLNHNALYESVLPLLGIKTEDVRIPYWRVQYHIASFAERFMQQPGLPQQQFVFEVQPFRLNERMAVQQGVFLCPISVDLPFINSLAGTFNLSPSVFEDAKTEDYDPRMHARKNMKDTAVIKLVLPLATHFDALEDLWRMNVTAATLFSGLDGFARSLHYFVRRDNALQIKMQSA